MKWLLKDTPALFTDLYELTMAQAYFDNKINEPASFEVTVRKLPVDWGFFVMAGLAELKGYFEAFHFSKEDIDFLKSLGRFSDEFLDFLKLLKPDIQIRALPEGTVFFATEPVLEITGPLINAQIFESCVLNILGFSIAEASLAARYMIAAKGVDLMEFGLRRSQGPVASVRAARGAQMAGFGSTSNLFASRLLDLMPSGTMAHSFVEIHGSEENAFVNFIKSYGPKSVLLIDTFDAPEGIKKAAAIAKKVLINDNVKVRGIRIDSGDIIHLTKFARDHFAQAGLDFLKIYVSGNMDEYNISELLAGGAEVDGFGVGTSFSVSRYAPAIDIIYKISEYNGRKMFKSSPQKATLPGRKTIVRNKKKYYEKDVIKNYDPASEDLLIPFCNPEKMQIIQDRMQNQLSCLKWPIKKIKDPQKYNVEIEI